MGFSLFVRRKGSAMLLRMVVLGLFVTATQAGHTGDDLRVEGAIQYLASDTVVVHDFIFRVDAQTEIRGPSGPVPFALLEVGLFVEVRARPASGGNWRATRIEFDQEIELSGRLAALHGDTLIVQGVRFVGDSLTEVNAPHGLPIALPDLMPGDSVEIRGSLMPGAVYYALRIDLEEEEEAFRFRGRVDTLSPPNLRVSSRQLLVNGATRIRRPDETLIPLSALQQEDSVEVRVALRPDGVLLALRIDLLVEPVDTTIHGRLEQLFPSAVLVAGTVVQINAATRILSPSGQLLGMEELQVGDSLLLELARRPGQKWLAVQMIRVQALSQLWAHREGQAEKSALLGANYPNPFNPTTRIPLWVNAGGWKQVELVIYNLLGQPVRVLFRGLLDDGFYRFTWDGTDSRGKALPSGVYFSRLRVDGRPVAIRTMILQR